MHRGSQLQHLLYACWLADAAMSCCPTRPHEPSYMQSATDKATAVKKTQETKKKAAPKRKSAAGKDEGEETPKKKATPKKKQGGKKGGDKNGEVLKEFQQHVNMDEDELKVRHWGGAEGLTSCTCSKTGGTLPIRLGSQMLRQILLQHLAAC